MAIAKTLAKHGIFLPMLHKDELDNIIAETDAATDALIEERQKGSYSSRRAQAAKRALEEQALIDRIHAKLP